MDQQHLVFSNHGKVVTDSLTVANVFEKRHDNVIRDIRNIIANIDSEWGVLNFEDTTYTKQQNGQTYQKYLMTEDGFTLLAMGYTGKDAMHFKVAYIKEFRRMQQELAHQQEVFSYMIADPIERAERWIEEERERQSLQAQKMMLEQRIAEYEPKLTYVDQILESTNTVTISQIAKDYGLSGQKLNDLLHKEKVQYKINDQWLLYQEHVGMGYTKSKTTEYVNSKGRHMARMSTEWTQKGRLFIHHLLSKRDVVPVVDRMDDDRQEDLVLVGDLQQPIQ